MQDDEEPKDSQFSPDGAYIPRIFFLSTYNYSLYVIAAAVCFQFYKALKSKIFEVLLSVKLFFAFILQHPMERC